VWGFTPLDNESFSIATITSITTMFACSEDDIMLALCEKDTDLWEYVDKYMSWADIEQFVSSRGYPVVDVALHERFREHDKYISCAIYSSMWFKMYFPSEKHKATFLLKYGPFKKRKRTHA